jgi:hypothetical protein
MTIAAMTIELRMELARSLKDRRQVVRSLKETLRHGFNVSVAEMDEAVTWQTATLVAGLPARADGPGGASGGAAVGGAGRRDFQLLVGVCRLEAGSPAAAVTRQGVRHA